MRHTLRRYAPIAELERGRFERCDPERVSDYCVLLLSLGKELALACKVVLGRTCLAIEREALGDSDNNLVNHGLVTKTFDRALFCPIGRKFEILNIAGQRSAGCCQLFGKHGVPDSLELSKALALIDRTDKAIQPHIFEGFFYLSATNQLVSAKLACGLFRKHTIEQHDQFLIVSITAEGYALIGHRLPFVVGFDSVQGLVILLQCLELDEHLGILGGQSTALGVSGNLDTHVVGVRSVGAPHFGAFHGAELSAHVVASGLVAVLNSLVERGGDVLRLLSGQNSFLLVQELHQLGDGQLVQLASLGDCIVVSINFQHSYYLLFSQLVYIGHGVLPLVVVASPPVLPSARPYVKWSQL
nr:MAG TPA: hypothetical protein [Caudoviricetes sp.]